MSRSMRRLLLRSVAGCSLVVAAVAGPAPVDASSSTDEVWVSFSGGTAGEPITAVANAGSAATTQSIRTANGGQLIARRTSVSTGLAADYPAYDGARTGARAVVAVTNAGTTDQLSPGARAFVIGADVKLDATSEGTVYDDGNNLIQRGLFNDAAQYKLQIDGNRFSCRVKGAGGVQDVWSPLMLAPGTWYRATCLREVLKAGDRLVLKVAPLNSDGSTGTVNTATSPTGPIGRLGFAVGIPLSLGGKLNPDRSIAPDADPLNGVLDNAYLDIR